MRTFLAILAVFLAIIDFTYADRPWPLRRNHRHRDRHNHENNEDEAGFERFFRSLLPDRPRRDDSELPIVPYPPHRFEPPMMPTRPSPIPSPSPTTTPISRQERRPETQTPHRPSGDQISASFQPPHYGSEASLGFNFLSLKCEKRSPPPDLGEETRDLVGKTVFVQLHEAMVDPLADFPLGCSNHCAPWYKPFKSCQEPSLYEAADTIMSEQKSQNKKNLGEKRTSELMETPATRLRECFCSSLDMYIDAHRDCKRCISKETGNNQKRMPSLRKIQRLCTSVHDNAKFLAEFRAKGFDDEEDLGSSGRTFNLDSSYAVFVTILFAVISFGMF